VSARTPPGPALIASVGIFVLWRSLPPGDQQLSVTVGYVDTLSLDAAIHVG